jgi:hypothetical protein
MGQCSIGLQRPQKLGFLSSLNINKKFLIDIWHLGPWLDDGRYGPIELTGSKLGFLSLFAINIKFLIDRVPSCPSFEIWDFGRIEEYAIGTADHGIITHYFSHAKTFQTSPHKFNSIQKNSSYTWKGVFLVRVLDKARFPDF